MSVEQTARDFVAHMDDVQKIRSLLTPDAMMSGGALPAPMPASEAMGMASALKTAFPDMQMHVDKVTVNGNQAKVDATWSGTQTGALSLPIPGMPSLPPTGKKVNVKDSYLVTVDGDKVSRMEVQSPKDGGIPGALAQLGMKVPGM
jgi:predicted ester cyclase